MMTSAELRWFWPGRCSQLVHDWFFKTGLAPGGGLSRVDRYIPQRGEPNASLAYLANRKGYHAMAALAAAGAWLFGAATVLILYGR